MSIAELVTTIAGICAILTFLFVYKPHRKFYSILTYIEKFAPFRLAKQQPVSEYIPIYDAITYISEESEDGQLLRAPTHADTGYTFERILDALRDAALRDIIRIRGQQTHDGDVMERAIEPSYWIKMHFHLVNCMDSNPGHKRQTKSLKDIFQHGFDEDVQKLPKFSKLAVNKKQLEAVFPRKAVAEASKQAVIAKLKREKERAEKHYLSKRIVDDGALGTLKEQVKRWEQNVLGILRDRTYFTERERLSFEDIGQIQPGGPGTAYNLEHKILLVRLGRQLTTLQEIIDCSSVTY